MATPAPGKTCCCFASVKPPVCNNNNSSTCCCSQGAQPCKSAEYNGLGNEASVIDITNQATAILNDRGMPHPLLWNYNAGYTSNSWPSSPGEVVNLNTTIAMKNNTDMFAASAGNEVAFNALYVPPGLIATLKVQDVISGACSGTSQTITVKGGLSGQLIPDFQNSTLMRNKLILFRQTPVNGIEVCDNCPMCSTCNGLEWMDDGKSTVQCAESIRFTLDPDLIGTNELYSSFLVRYSCFPDNTATKSNSIKGYVNGELRVLENLQGGHEPCDTFVAQYCSELEHTQETICACFREAENIGQEFPDVPIPITPSCFGQCTSADAYKTRAFAADSCNETICSQIVDLIGNSLAESGSQELVCDNKTFIFGPTPTISPTPADEDSSNSGGINRNTTIVFAVAGALFFLVFIIFIALFARQKLQTTLR